MDRRDLELLHKQIGHFGPARRNDGVLILALTVVFFAGIALGSFLFKPPTEPPEQTAATEVVPAVTLAR